jgi:hypothetical protein
VADWEDAGHVTLTPGVAAKTPGAQPWHVAFLLSISHWISGVNRDRPKAFVGVGAFNLVRAATYRRCGGYQALRLTVVDDVKLGLLMRRAGVRTRAFIGADEIECHWGTTVGGLIKVMEKNFFAALEFRLAAVVALAVGGVLMMGAVIIGPFTGSIAGIAAGLAPLSLVVPAAIGARRLGWSIGSAVAAPFMFPVFLYAMVRSTFVALRHGGIRWRDTFYPLNLLRAGNLR